MTWEHSCGWTGEVSELRKEYYGEFLTSLACPQCGEQWLDIHEEFDMPEPEPRQPTIDHHGSRKLWEGE